MLKVNYRIKEFGEKLALGVEYSEGVGIVVSNSQIMLEDGTLKNLGGTWIKFSGEAVDELHTIAEEYPDSAIKTIAEYIQRHPSQSAVYKALGLLLANNRVCKF